VEVSVRRIARVSALCIAGLSMTTFGQTLLPRVAPDEAAKHLLNKITPNYPPEAELARIQGYVILEIGIDESGVALERRLISGHPLLVPAAIEAVRRSKFRPFEVNGKPTPVITLAVVTFGNPKNNESETRNEVLFQENFWSAEESAQTALANGNYPDAEQHLNRARDLLPPAPESGQHRRERWRWVMDMGDLCRAQKKYQEAEQNYKQALDLRPGNDKNAPEIAETLQSLSRLYIEERRYDLARDDATRSVAIYQKNFKRADSHDQIARKRFGRAIAYQSWLLLSLAPQSNQRVEIKKQCGTVLEFQTFLDAADQASFVPICETAISSPAKKD